MRLDVFITSVITAAIPLLLAGTGEVLVERAGVINLASEGAMILAAASAAITAITTGNPWLGFAAGIVVGLVWTLFFALLPIGLKVNQIIAGIALSIAGLGLSSLIARGYEGYTVPSIPSLKDVLPILPPLDVLSPILLVIPLLIHWLLSRTRLGLYIRAVGDNPIAADSFGVDVAVTRLVAASIDGILLGLSGAYIVLVTTQRWVEGVTGGRGWIAVALAPFSYWEPLLVYVGAFLFAGLEVLQYVAQALPVRVPRELLLSTPYLVLILALVVVRSRRLQKRVPRALGVEFRRV
ncbi:MAG TPA: ABC transporter permease [Pyrodictium sp.]|nr:ABC transporter permease [Pyrodictium sp.]